MKLKAERVPCLREEYGVRRMEYGADPVDTLSGRLLSRITRSGIVRF